LLIECEDNESSKLMPAKIIDSFSENQNH